MSEQIDQTGQVDDVDVDDRDLPEGDLAEEDDEDYEPPLNPVMMTLSSIGLFIGFVAFVVVCIPMWWNGSGH